MLLLIVTAIYRQTKKYALFSWYKWCRATVVPKTVLIRFHWVYFCKIEENYFHKDKS